MHTIPCYPLRRGHVCINCVSFTNNLDIKRCIFKNCNGAYSTYWGYGYAFCTNVIMEIFFSKNRDTILDAIAIKAQNRLWGFRDLSKLGRGMQNFSCKYHYLVNLAKIWKISDKMFWQSKFLTLVYTLTFHKPGFSFHPKMVFKNTRWYLVGIYTLLTKSNG